jgi:hypothetical protein
MRRTEGQYQELDNDFDRKHFIYYASGIKYLKIDEFHANIGSDTPYRYFTDTCNFY